MQCQRILWASFQYSHRYTWKNSSSNTSNPQQNPQHAHRDSRIRPRRNGYPRPLRKQRPAAAITAPAACKPIFRETRLMNVIVVAQYAVLLLHASVASSSHSDPGRSDSAAPPRLYYRFYGSIPWSSRHFASPSWSLSDSLVITCHQIPPPTISAGIRARLRLGCRRISRHRACCLHHWDDMPASSSPDARRALRTDLHRLLSSATPMREPRTKRARRPNRAGKCERRLQRRTNAPASPAKCTIARAYCSIAPRAPSHRTRPANTTGTSSKLNRQPAERTGYCRANFELITADTACATQMRSSRADGNLMHLCSPQRCACPLGSRDSAPGYPSLLPESPVPALRRRAQNPRRTGHRRRRSPQRAQALRSSKTTVTIHWAGWSALVGT